MGFAHGISPFNALRLTFGVSHQGQQSIERQEQILDQIGVVQAGTERLEEKYSQVALSKQGIGAAILNILTSQVGSTVQAHEKQSLQKHLITAIYQDSATEITTNASIPLIPVNRQEHLREVFLSRLRYPRMEDREDRIAQAHEKTFQWIFEETNLQQTRWSNFKDWLESDSQLYWITGKAGSGKSTLMKYICQPDDEVSDGGMLPNTGGRYESRCSKHLKKWAGDSQSITAAFFFWNSGVELQMSQRGLLLSLLYQLIRQAPYLIGTVSPKRWEALCLFNDDPGEWSLPELHEMLRIAAKEVSRTMSLCLFVDGLDEFEGEHNDLICLFQDLIQNGNVKVCVASRPWVVFEDAFKHKPSMMLQDLTYSDIKYYVTSNLQDDSNFAQLRRREPKYADQLIENVVSKASGVFLWVHLVVASLLAGMGFGDRVSDLQKRLDLLPPDLERLYDKILQSLDPFYLEHAAQLFKLVQESYGPPPLILLSFADEEGLDPYDNWKIKPLSQDELSLRTDTMRRRLNSRCKGFLEVGNKSKGANSVATEETVQYLHRTVKDYVESKEAQGTVGAAIKSDFDPHQRLCVGSLAHLKAIEADEDFLANGAFWARVHRCLYSAAQIQSTNRASIVPLLDELDKTGRTLAKRIATFVVPWSVCESENPNLLVSLLETGQWVPSHPCFTSLTEQTVFGATFLSLVVRYGIVEYIEAKANQACLVQHFHNGVWPLLLDAVYVDSKSRIGPPNAVPHLDIINCLLKKGADLNYPIHGIKGVNQSSIWLQTLHHMREKYDYVELKSPWLEIAETMIRHGARVDMNHWRHLIWNSSTRGRKEASLLNYLYIVKQRVSRSWFPWISGPSRRRPPSLEEAVPLWRQQQRPLGS